MPVNPPGYVQVSRNYVTEKPAIAAYSVGWQYENPLPPPPMSTNAPTARAVAGSVPSSRSVSGEVIEAQTKEKWHYYEYQGGPPGPVNSSLEDEPSVPAQQEVPTIPVLLCHTCTVCGRMRSAGFHRSNPVIPGQPLISGVCLRCKKKQRQTEEDQCRRRVTRIRKCTTNKPCNWPEEPLHIQIDGGERRGRRRSRSYDRGEVHIMRHRSCSRPQVIKRSESRNRMGLRILQDDRSPSRVRRRKTEVRYTSMSPHRETVRIRETVASPAAASGPPPPLFYETNPPLRGEQVPPPPMHYGARSNSLLSYNNKEEYNNRGAMERIASHPMPYRSVLPDQRALIREPSDDLPPARGPALITRATRSPSRGILKTGGMDQETAYRRRMSMRGSHESTMVEVGGPRVQFVQDSSRVPTRPLPESSSGEYHRIRARRRELDGHYSSSEDYHDYYHRRAGATTPYLEDPLPFRRPESPLSRCFEERHVRCVSPQRPERGRSRVRYVSPLPEPLPPRERVAINFESVRRQSPPPLEERVAVSYRRDARPLSPSERISSSYRTVRPALPEPESSSPYFQDKEKDWDDVTTSSSDDSREVVTVRTWRGIDENGEPATFVEERTTHYVSERDRDGNERPGQNAPPGSWRDV